MRIGNRGAPMIIRASESGDRIRNCSIGLFSASFQFGVSPSPDFRFGNPSYYARDRVTERATLP
jgi:hypothetical protein